MDGFNVAGATYVVYGSHSGADVDLANLGPGQGIRIDGPQTSESGFSVASAGDVNGDGLADLVIGAPYDSSNGREDAGAAYVIFGQAGGLSNIDLTNLTPGEGFRIAGAVAGAHTGYSVSSAGDFNGDGFADIIIGAPAARIGGSLNAGSAYVIFGHASGFGDIDLANLSPADGFRLNDAAELNGYLFGNQVGFSVASAGDVDGDGYSDLLVGAPSANNYGSGVTYVIYGEPSAAVNKVGTAGNDRLFGGDFNDSLSGGDGNDVLGGKQGDDLLTGGAGNDTFVYSVRGEQHDTVTDFQQGQDVIDVAAANIGSFATLQQLLSTDAQGNAVITSMFDGMSSTMTLTGVSAAQLTAADFVFAPASPGAHTQTGTDNADDLFGTDGSDSLQGNGGDDRLFGEGGYDVLIGGPGADLLDGGAGSDIANYALAPAGVIASLATGGTGGDAAGDVYVSIEDLYGSDFNDVLEGSDQANIILGYSGANIIRGLGGNDYLAGGNECDTFYGGAGADHIDGAGGFDYARYDDSPSGVTISVVGQGTGGDAAGDLLSNIEGLVGSAFADNLGGSVGSNDLQGLAGDDVLIGRWGDDTLDGGDGNDSAVYSGARANYLVTFDDATQSYIVDDLREGSPDGTDHVRNVETFVFADGAIPVGLVLDGNPVVVIEGDDGDNALTGTALANEMHGLGGNDTLAGLAGDDLLDGGPGDDLLDGGTGADTASYTPAAAGVTVSLAIAGAQDTGGAGVDTLVSIESLTGGAFGDNLTGNDSANVLIGLAGNDRSDGAGRAAPLPGGDGDDILIGGAGGDILDGGAGFDFVSYETATPNPLLPWFGLSIDLGTPRNNIGDAAGDTLLNIEGVIGSNFSDVIMGSGADETLNGAGGEDVISGNGGTDILIGGSGDDKFIATTGIERFEGDDGVDLVSYYNVPVTITVDPDTFDYIITGEGVTVDMADPSRGTGFAAGDTFTGVEVLNGSLASDVLSGDEQDNTIFGDYGDDIISGRGGNDALNGGEGNDRLIGGAGADALTGGGGFDVASYETATSGIIVSFTHPAINTGDAAGDTYSFISGLIGSAFDDRLEGTAFAPNSLAGGAGNDMLIGLGGNDDFDGGAGNDTAVLAGNRADYDITFDAATQTFTLSATWLGVSHVTSVETLQFADITMSVTSLIAGDNNDNSLSGTAGRDDISGGGGNDTLLALAGDDRLAGGAGNDVLSGGAGNDTILGGDGNDTLLGGAADDTLDGGAGRDVASYADATAAVRVDLGAGGAQATGGAGTDTLVGIEDLVSSAFNDTLIGYVGDNVLLGGAGDDLLMGLSGNDTLDGGAGSDTVSYTAVSNDVTVDLALAGPQYIGWAEETDTLINVENVVGTMYWNNTLEGDSGANRLTGGLVNDTLIGRGGDDVLDGSGGSDTASYAQASAGVTVDLAVIGPQSTGEGSDTLISIENLTGSAFGDTLKGTSGDNVFIGGAGDDTFFGRGGNDRFDGGDGIDTVSYDGVATGVQVDLNLGWQYTGAGSEVLLGIENLAG